MGLDLSRGHLLIREIIELRRSVRPLRRRTPSRRSTHCRDAHSIPNMPDPSMSIANDLAALIGPAPPWDAPVAECVRLVEFTETNALAVRNQHPVNALEWYIDLHRVFFDWSSKPESVPNVAAHYDRMNILLRLWAGCISAGKMLALGTRDGTTSPEQRAASFGMIDSAAKTCPIYRLGVEAAYAWKQGRREEVSFEGVPADSAARKHYRP